MCVCVCLQFVQFMIIQVIFLFLTVGMMAEAHCNGGGYYDSLEKGTNTGRKPVESKAFF